MMIRCLLIEEMIISDIDKKRKLGFLLSIIMMVLIYNLSKNQLVERHADVTEMNCAQVNFGLATPRSITCD